VPNPLRVAVTGSGGFIGRHVVAALTARGDTPVPVRHPFDANTLANTFAQIDAVVHLAGVVSAVRRQEYFSANVDATRLVAQAAARASRPLIHISSQAAGGPAPASAPRSEDDPPSPINPYGESKLAGERAVQDIDALRWTILRPGVVYGPGDRAMLPLFQYAQFGILPLVGSADAAYIFIYVDDVVRAILTALDRGPLQTIMFLGHERPVTPRTLMNEIRTAAGSAAFVLPIPRPLVWIGAIGGDIAGAITRKPATINSRRFAELYAPGFVCRVDRLRDRLGFSAGVDLSTGIAHTAAWYRLQGWLRNAR